MPALTVPIRDTSRNIACLPARAKKQTTMIDRLRPAELALIVNARDDQKLEQDLALDHERQTAPSVLGRVLEQAAPGFSTKTIDGRLYLNTNAPMSGVVCGVQGSGKSHTSSVILENFLIKDKMLGTSKGGLAGLVFHFDSNATDGANLPCEAAYLSLPASTSGPCAEVTVLVSPTNLDRMREVYEDLPVKVEALHFSSKDITAARMLNMMMIGDKRPLYIETVMSELRLIPSTEFDYQKFCDRIFKMKWAPAQLGGLKQRLGILNTFLNGGTDENRAANYFGPGKLVIVDLTDPFYDPVTCSGIFDLVLGMFDAVSIPTGKFVLLDEAHKYLDHESRLTANVLSLIRQQRHRGMRVIISTQEPTVVDDTVLDLCSFVIVHRFSSPAWANHLNHHVRVSSGSDQSHQNWFDVASSLHTGEALVFSPAGLGLKKTVTLSSAMAGLSFDEDEDVKPTESDLQKARSARYHDLEPGALGSGYFKIKTRRRLTADGGVSILAV